jgi:hypothetical protein
MLIGIINSGITSDLDAQKGPNHIRKGNRHHHFLNHLRLTLNLVEAVKHVIIVRIIFLLPLSLFLVFIITIELA